MSDKVKDIKDIKKDSLLKVRNVLNKDIDDDLKLMMITDIMYRYKREKSSCVSNLVDQS